MQVFRERTVGAGHFIGVFGERIPLSVVLSKWSVYFGWADKQIGVDVCKHWILLWRPYKHGHKAHAFEWRWLREPRLFVDHIQYERRMRKRDLAARKELEVWLAERDQNGRG